MRRVCCVAGRVVDWALAASICGLRITIICACGAQPQPVPLPAGHFEMQSEKNDNCDISLKSEPSYSCVLGSPSDSFSEGTICVPGEVVPGPCAGFAPRIWAIQYIICMCDCVLFRHDIFARAHRTLKAELYCVISAVSVIFIRSTTHPRAAAERTAGGVCAARLYGATR